MKTLLENIQARLKDQITFVRDSSIYVADDLRMIPLNVAKFPAIGILDAGISYAVEYQDEHYDADMRVKIAAYVQIFKETEAVMGEQGALTLIAEIRDALVDNTLSISGLILAMPHSETGVELGFRDSDMVIMKTLTMRYLKINTYT